MPNPSKPPVAQWLRLVTLIAAVEVSRTRLVILFSSLVLFSVVIFRAKIQILIPERIPFRNRFLQDFSEYHILLVAARMDFRKLFKS